MALSDEPIVNRVANSPLKTFDLETLYTEGSRIALDIAQWFEDGEILRESAFRNALKAADLEGYKEHMWPCIAAADTILPQWTYSLVTTALAPIAETVIVGDLEQLEVVLYERPLRLLISRFIKMPRLYSRGVRQTCT
jgi:hypothetical protein